MRTDDWPEDDWLPISGLQHLVFCERQCALILVEGLWADNWLTVDGGHLHDRVHGDLSTECRGELRIARRLAIRSARLGLTGYADVVEFHFRGDPDGLGGGGAAGARLPGVPGRWTPFPVEYKRGRAKPDQCDEVQLCAQALCLEEMLGTPVAEGALYYGTPRRRQVVGIDQALREFTRTTAERLHALVRSGATPPAEYADRCDRCSLVELCLPRAGRSRPGVRAYLRSAVFSDAADQKPEGP